MHSKSILAVDGVELVRDVLSHLLSHHNVRKADCGIEALKLADAHYFDLYIVEFDLPDMAGDDLCRRIRAKDANVPILMFTGHSEPAHDHVTPWTAWLDKSADVATVIRQVERLLVRQDLAAMQAELITIADDMAQRRNTYSAGLHSDEIRYRFEEIVARLRALKPEDRKRALMINALRSYVLSGATQRSFDRYWAEVSGQSAAKKSIPTKPPERQGGD